MPEAAVAVAGVLILVGGLCVLTGFQPHLGLSCIALFLVCVTPMMHNFWALTDPMERMNEMGRFLSNAALLGGTFMMSRCRARGRTASSCGGGSGRRVCTRTAFSRCPPPGRAVP